MDDQKPTPSPAAPAGPRPPQTVTWLAVIAVLGIGIGLFLGLSPVSNCGSPWNPDYTAAQHDEDVARLTDAMAGLPHHQQDAAAGCQDQFGSRGTLATGTLVLGGVAGIAAFAIRNRDTTTAQAGNADTTSST